MSKDRLNELKEELKLAKEVNELTVENITRIVSNATSSIIKELKFDKDVTGDALKDVFETTVHTLEEFGESTAENIKVTRDSALDGVQTALKDEMSFHTKKFEELHHIIADTWPEDMKMVFNEAKDSVIEAIGNVTSFAEFSLDVLRSATDGALKGAQEVLDKKSK